MSEHVKGRRVCLNCGGSGVSHYSADELGKAVTCSRCAGGGAEQSTPADTSREQFEAWCELTSRSVRRDNCGNYESAPVDADWEAWQASRACNVRIPPMEWFGDNFAGYAIDKHALVAILEEQGFTVEDEE